MSLHTYVSDDWLFAQRAALAASACDSAIRSGTVSVAETRFLFASLMDLPRGRAPLDELAKNNLRRMALRLTPATLRRLPAIARSSGESGWALLEHAFVRSEKLVCDTDKKGRSLAGTAKLIADRLLRANLTGARLSEICRKELPKSKKDDYWRHEKDVWLALDRLMYSLRKSTSVCARLKAIKAFRQNLSDPPPVWLCIEQALLQRILTWIPVTVPHDGGRAGHLVPVAIDVGASGGHPESVLSGLQDFTAEIVDSVERARNAAVRLWLQRYPYCSAIQRSAVEQARFVVDFGLLPTLRPNLEIGGSSLEAPLALAAYGRLIGEIDQSQVCATGALGAFIPDAEAKLTGDTRIVAIEDEPAKYEVAAAQLFDLMLVPELKHAGRRLGTALADGRTLSNYVDHAFGQQGSKHRWVRCPDLRRSWKLQMYSLECGKAREELSSGVGMLETNLPAKLIIDALFEISRLAANRNRQYIPTYAVVRLVEGEEGERAWQTIWQAIGGNAQDFENFRWATSDAARADWLSRQFERQSDDLGNQPAPDVLVLCGVPPFDRLGIDQSPFCRFSIRRVARAAAARLGRSRSRQSPLECQLGTLRLVLVEDDGCEIEANASPEQSADITRHHAELSIFRHGFTPEMGRRFLRDGNANRLYPGDADHILSQLEDLGYLQSSHSDRFQAPGSCELFLPAPSALSVVDEGLAALHMRAAKAIASFLDGEPYAARFDYTIALAPHWLHEAQWHARQATQIYRRLEGVRARSHDLADGLCVRLGRQASEATEAAQRLNRIGEMFGFASFRWEIGRGAEASMDLYRTYVALLEQRDIAHHPTHYLLAAQAARALWSRDREWQEALASDAFRFVRKARYAASRIHCQAQQKACLLLIASEECLLLERVGADQSHINRAYAEAGALMKYAREIWDMDWIMEAGDRCPDNREAGPIYYRAVTITGGFNNAGMLVRWLGSLGPQHLDLANTRRLCREVTPQARKWLSTKQIPPAHWRPHVRRRWHLGLSRLNKLAPIKVRPFDEAAPDPDEEKTG